MIFSVLRGRRQSDWSRPCHNIPLDQLFRWTTPGPLDKKGRILEHPGRSTNQLGEISATSALSWDGDAVLDLDSVNQMSPPVEQPSKFTL
jgi:hypothetical protein